MKIKEKLTHEERNFFSYVKDAVLANPFSDKRAEIDKNISGLSSSSPRSERIEKAIECVKKRIHSLDDRNVGNITLFEGKDQILVKAAFAFDFFYTFRKKIDRLIDEQIKLGDKVAKLSFAPDAKLFLQRRGFDEDSIKRTIEESYQFRRAFYFIDRTLVGTSDVMKELRFDLWSNVFTQNLNLYREYLWNRMEDFSTLILGGTGTGKGTVAAAIGRSGYIPFDMKKNRFTESFTQSFNSINFSQFPETLIESELFGHRKGSFTGAIENYHGVFSRCSPNGSILLDEIGEISEPIQIKLLQVLQERFFYPVGSRKKERFYGRVIAATNRSIDDLRRKKIFRDDFYYRLCSDIITVPPLSVRIEQDPQELENLLQFIVNKMIGRESQELVAMITEVIDKELGRNYPWHGNVRELEQCVRRILLRKDYKGDGKKNTNQMDLQSILCSGIEKGTLPANQLMSGYCKLLYDRFGTFGEVAKRTHLDRRTVNKYIKEFESDKNRAIGD